MKPFPFLLLTCFFTTQFCISQEYQLYGCVSADTTSATSAKVNIYIFSHPGCGFCRRAMKDLGEWSQGKPIHLIAMDFSGKPETIGQSSLYADYGIEVRDASSCDDRLKNFIPKIFIHETTNQKRVMKLRGWHSKDLRKVERKTKRLL